jgi:hypothetical protein
MADRRCPHRPARAELPAPNMPAKKTSSKTINKSDFIRRHASLSTAEIIAAGKKAGLKISSSLVYMVRGRAAKSKKTVAKKTTPSKSAAPTSTSDPTKPTQSNADFVRSRSHLSPREIVEDARTAGLQLNVKYVYNWRRAAAKGATKKRWGVKQTTTSKATLANGVRSPASSSAETLLRAVAAEIGLGRAIEILAGERARVRAVIGAG